MQYTAGELAKRLGISSRTVRFYDEKDLLRPCGYSKAGYRLYDELSAQRLQKILMLKYMDFSLDQISDIMQKDNSNLRDSLKNQENLLIEKKEHLLRMIDAVKKMEEATDETIWDSMREVIEMTMHREEVIKQYNDDYNLNQRINIHAYSTAKEEFYSWMLQRVDISRGMKILDIGCGNAMFWRKIAYKLPEDLEIHLVDYSQGMLDSARKNVSYILEDYPQKNLKFVIDKRDATDFNYPVDGFDRIMANHMLYHINRESREKLYRKIVGMLNENGRFSCTLTGQNHMKEINEIAKSQEEEIVFSAAQFDILLENANQELKQFFQVLSVEEQENDLQIPDATVVLDYISSFSDQAKRQVAMNREQLLDAVERRMKDGYLFVHKSTGIVICK